MEPVLELTESQMARLTRKLARAGYAPLKLPELQPRQNVRVSALQAIAAATTVEAARQVVADVESIPIEPRTKRMVRQALAFRERELAR